MFEYIAPEVGFFQKLIISNLWLFDRVLKFVLSKSKSTRACMHTTTAVTVISGGTKSNVLPAHARV